MRQVSALGEGLGENVRKDEWTGIGATQAATRLAESTTVPGKESMMDNRFEVTVGAGTMMSRSVAAIGFPHRWTSGGVTAEADFTGGHLFHLAAAGCVLNDLYREAAALGIELRGVRVTAAGGFDSATWQSTGIDYSVEISSDASADQLAHLLEAVDRVAEIPRAIRAGATVRRIG
jgi:uncharacterized OsmC-like protein